jgi:hypothetical protein
MCLAKRFKVTSKKVGQKEKVLLKLKKKQKGYR